MGFLFSVNALAPVEGADGVLQICATTARLCDSRAISRAAGQSPSPRHALSQAGTGASRI